MTDTIASFINNFTDPEHPTLRPFAHADISEHGDTLLITVGYPLAQEQARLRSALAAQLNRPADSIHLETVIKKHAVQINLQPLSMVKNIIAVASGKGGVGKSTVSVNLACALQAQGAAVGLLDADIYGPSQPMMLGGVKRPESKDGKTMEPIMRHGLQTLSIGDIVEDDTAMIWRGPMVTQTLMQLMRECNWRTLDYLVIDLPPGTGDTQLTLAQQIPVAGAVIVTTPQDIALLDVKRAKTMFDKVRIPSLGLIENMSVYHCPNCGHEAHLFGKDGGRKLAAQYHLDLLGQLPLDIKTREYGDNGTPITLAEPDSESAKIFRHIAYHLGINLAAREKVHGHTFPKIVVE